MQDLLSRLIASGFAEFQGLNITGSVPIKQEVINELIAEVLQNAGKSEAPPESAAGAASLPRIEASALLELIKRAEIKADDGKIILEFDIRVDDVPQG